MHIVIMGCGILGSSLAAEFSCQGHDVSVIDNVEENFLKLGDSFYGRIIRCLEIDNSALIKAGIKDADIFLAVAHDDNLNIMMSQIAKDIHGVKTIIAGIVDPLCEALYRKLGIEYISETSLAVNAVKNKVSEEMVK